MARGDKIPRPSSGPQQTADLRVRMTQAEHRIATGGGGGGEGVVGFSQAIPASALVLNPALGSNVQVALLREYLPEILAVGGTEVWGGSVYLTGFVTIAPNQWGYAGSVHLARVRNASIQIPTPGFVANPAPRLVQPYEEGWRQWVPTAFRVNPGPDAHFIARSANNTSLDTNGTWAGAADPGDVDIILCRDLAQSQPDTEKSWDLKGSWPCERLPRDGGPSSEPGPGGTTYILGDRAGDASNVVLQWGALTTPGSYSSSAGVHRPFLTASDGAESFSTSHVRLAISVAIPDGSVATHIGELKTSFDDSGRTFPLASTFGHPSPRLEVTSRPASTPNAPPSPAGIAQIEGQKQVYFYPYAGSPSGPVLLEIVGEYVTS